MEYARETEKLIYIDQLYGKGPILTVILSYHSGLQQCFGHYLFKVSTNERCTKNLFEELPVRDVVLWKAMVVHGVVDKMGYGSGVTVMNALIDYDSS
ncbi:hypothetical protein Q3G72_025345 [Acer saccharum]|nr:hypothetical protein Q3G72_025345 [Acer saccharum]